MSLIDQRKINFKLEANEMLQRDELKSVLGGHSDCSNNVIGFIGGGILKYFSIYNSQNKLILEQFRDKVKIASELITDGFKIIKRGKKAFVSTTFTNKTNTSEVSLNNQILEINNTLVKDLSNTEIEQLKTKLGNIISYKLKRKKNIFFIKTKVKNFLE
ncbi:hypothetical protein [Cellulophaga lytica]|uniref:hypothetical protein n=1 Tax=Cellulophaga lytica TaxID=979 RepID=UPI000B5C7818|nr:hypothetical protein [Cellulophaga lytica]SNQ44547.1 conserved hypothetical protein [Cellulophaga lytica]